MVRRDLVREVAKETGASIQIVKKVVDKIMSTTVEALINKEDVTLKGLGVFKVRHTAARKGRNLNTGEPMDIPAHDRVVFTPSKQIRNALK